MHKPVCMMEATGQPISQYVAKKLNFSYEQASSSINEALKAETKKKIHLEIQNLKKEIKLLKVYFIFLQHSMFVKVYYLVCI